jgi:hypothetical protein
MSGHPRIAKNFKNDAFTGWEKKRPSAGPRPGDISTGEKVPR